MKYINRLFKYLDIKGAKAMLSKANLQFTNSLDFNDPFDCHPSLIDFSYKSKGRYGTLVMDNARKRCEELYAGLRDRTWICALSKIHDSILMWSHYANKHQGVCIELNIAHVMRFLAEPRCGRIIHNVGVEVQYKDIVEKPKYFDNNINHLEYQISTKGKQWEHEQEWRLYVIDPVRSYTKSGRLYPKLGGECFEAIYLGAKISDADKRKIIRLAKKVNQNIKIYQMGIDTDAFRLEVSEVMQDA